MLRPNKHVQISRGKALNTDGGQDGGKLEIVRTERMPVFEMATNHKENVDRVKALTIWFVNAQPAFAKLARVGGMMLGTDFVRTSND